MNNSFYVYFETQGFPGANSHNLRAVKVAIEHEILSNWADHPLYPGLSAYVADNQRKRGN